MSAKSILTTSAGATSAVIRSLIAAGRRGPLSRQDHELLEKPAHQNRGRIPVHAKGWVAFATFTITHDISNSSQFID